MIDFLLEEFENLASITGSVPKLREIILQLAVSGRLTADWRHQHPDTEPASALLKRIESEKQRLIKEGKIKKQKPLPEITDEEKPFDIPETWEWVRLFYVSDQVTDGEHLSPTWQDEGHPILSAKHIGSRGVLFEEPKFVSESDFERIRKRCAPELGDLLIVSRGGGIGRCVINDLSSPFGLMGSVILVKTGDVIRNRFLLYYLNSRTGQAAVRSSNGYTAQQAIYLATIKTQLVVPFADAGEQQEIVRRVDQLMGLCDKLEQSHEERDETRKSAVVSLCSHLGEANPSVPFTEIWSQFVDRFTDIVTSPHDVKPVRDMVLQLAVSGRLTADWRHQHPDTEPASELLKHIESEKQRLIKEGKIKKQKPLPEITDEKKAFEIPDTWVWTNLAAVSLPYDQKKPDRPFRYIDVSLIDGRTGLMKGEPALVQPAGAPSRARKIVTQGDILFSTVRPYLKNVIVVPKDIMPMPIASTAFSVVRLSGRMRPGYLFYVLRSSYFIEYANQQMIGMAYPAISDAKFYSGLLPTPPAAEQEEIVRRVDQLMDLCDKLETTLAGVSSTGANLWTSLSATVVPNV